MTNILCKNYRLLDSQRVCCFDNESITIEHKFNEKNILSVIFNFHYNDTEDKKANYEVKSEENGKIVFDLYNFKSSLGTGLKKPQCIAKYNKKGIFIVFFVTLLPEANPILDYSLYMEV